jgi:hypothetical protein
VVVIGYTSLLVTELVKSVVMHEFEVYAPCIA